MEWQVVMKDRVWEQVHTLMHNIRKINEGDEIGGWLLGDWTPNAKDDKATLVLDEFIIPKQKVSGAEVDMSPESMSDMLKELGPEKCNRIKAHWHIHPFGTGKTNWSGIDEAKIKDFMDPTKGRGLFVFLLSSEDTLKARVELTFKGNNSFLGDVNLKQSFDDLEVGHEGSSNLAILSELEARIKEKVERSWVTTYKGGASSEEWNRYLSKDTGKPLEEKVADNRSGSVHFRIKRKGNKVRVRVNSDFWTWIEANDIMTPDALEQKGEWAFLEFNSFTAADAMDDKDALTAQLFELENMWIDEDIGENDTKYDSGSDDRDTKTDRDNEQTYFAY